MRIPIHVINYSFSSKPIVIGGQAMEYFGLRKAGNDTDLVITTEDFLQLSALYPNNIVEKYNEVGIAVSNFEMWPIFRKYTYWQLEKASHDEGLFRIINLKMLYTLKMLCASDERLDMETRRKYAKDLSLMTSQFANKVTAITMRPNLYLSLPESEL